MKLFNKSLIAAAITVTSVNAFAVSTATTGGNTEFSQEGILNATEIAIEETLSVVIAPTSNTYTNANVLRFTMAGATNTFATNVQVDIAATGAGAAVTANTGACNATGTALTVSSVNIAGGEVSVASETVIEVNLDSTAGQLFRNCLAADNGTDVNVTLSIVEDSAESYKVVPASTAVASEITLAYEAVSTSGLTGTVDSVAAVQIATVIDEYDLNVTTDADGQIDVGADRLLFAGGADTDTLVIGLDVATADTAAANLNNVDYTINADLSFLDADSDGTIDTNNDITVSAGFTIDTTDLTAVTISETAPAGAPVTVTFLVDGTREIPETSFSVDSVINYGQISTTDATWPVALSGAQSESDADAATGSWALNGVNNTINYMPFGDNISQIIYITNTSAVEGGISYTAFDDAGTEYSGDLPTVVAAETVTPLAGDLKTSLEAQGFTSGKLRIRFTTEVTAATVYAAYNVNGSDRGFVSNN